jgi:nicotinamidase/pyrazinamidase
MHALLLTDIQYDFLPGGALAVPRGDEVIAVAARLARSGAYHAIVATQDLHPPHHGSFASQHPGRLPYSQGMLEAALVDDLDLSQIAAVVPKGEDPLIDSYSGFFDNARRKKTTLEDTLRGLGITVIDVVGLATDYCVRATVLDALELGFRVRVHVEGVRAVDLVEGDGMRALEAMHRAGATLI